MEYYDDNTVGLNFDELRVKLNALSGEEVQVKLGFGPGYQRGVAAALAGRLVQPDDDQRAQYAEMWAGDVAVYVVAGLDRERAPHLVIARDLFRYATVDVAGNITVLAVDEIGSLFIQRAV